MPKYIAFLRAINVGGHTVKMVHLKSLFEELGFSNVETFIASGNVIFNTPSKNVASVEKKIEKHLHKKLGYEVTTFVRTTADLQKIVEYKPFSDKDLDSPGHTLYIGFLTESPAKEALAALLAAKPTVDDFHVFGNELYWVCSGKFSESLVSTGKLEKYLRMPTTIRNANTIRRLITKYSGS